MMREMQSPEGGYYSSASTPTRSTRKASSTSGRGRKSRRCSTTTNMRLPPLFYGLDQPPNFEGRAWHPADRAAAGGSSRERLGLSELQQCASSAAERARQAVRGRDAACAPGPGRENPHQWNALMIDGMAHAGSRIRTRRLAWRRRGGRWISSRQRMWKARPAAGDVQGRPRASERLSGRLRLPARGAAGDAAGGFPPGDLEASRRRLPMSLLGRSSRIGARAGSSSPVTTTKRLILRPKPGFGQRHAFGQRHRGAGASRASAICSASRAIWRRPSAGMRLFYPSTRCGTPVDFPRFAPRLRKYCEPTDGAVLRGRGMPLRPWQQDAFRRICPTR